MTNDPSLVHPADQKTPVSQDWLDHLWKFFTAIVQPLNLVGTKNPDTKKTVFALSVFESTMHEGVTCSARAREGGKGGREWVCYASGKSAFSALHALHSRVVDPETEWRENKPRYSDQVESNGQVDLDISKLLP